MSSIVELDFYGSLPGVQTTLFANVQHYNNFRLMLFCASDCVLTVRWSMDGVNGDYADIFNLVAGTTISHNLPVRSRYLQYELTPSVAPCATRLQSFFFDVNRGIHDLNNIGSGAKILAGESNIRSVRSADGSIIVTENASDIDLVISSSHVVTDIVPVTDDIQITEAPAGVYNLDVGHTTVGGANNTILGGKASYVGSIDATTTGCTIVGESFGSRSLIGIENSTAVGYRAGNKIGNDSIAIGHQAAEGSSTPGDEQGNYCVAIGAQAGQLGQGLLGADAFSGSVAIGKAAASNYQGRNSVAVGRTCGQFNQGVECVAVGFQSGYDAQGGVTGGGVAIGNKAGQYQQGHCSVAVGCFSGQGTSDGLNPQGEQSVAIGYQSGNIKQGAQSVAVGFEAGETNQGSTNVAIGYRAGQNNQTSGSANNSSVAIGADCALTNQGQLSVAVGAEAGRDNQAAQCVAIGRKSAAVSQKAYSVAIGDQAGKWDQGLYAIAIGTNAGIGENAGVKVGEQANNAIAVGGEAAMYGQNSEAIAIGRACAKGASDGSTPQPTRSIAFGSQCATPGAVGRLAFGNAMEPVHGSFSMPNAGVPQAYIKLEWNGVLYYVPAFTTVPV